MIKQMRSQETYLSIKAVRTREAEYADVPVTVGCPRCWDLGWLRQDLGHDEPEFGKLVKCPTCSEPERRKWLLAHCGLDGPLLDATLDGWKYGSWTGRADAAELAGQRKNAYDAMKYAVARRTGMFTWWGDFGAGKTHALATVCNELRGQMIETYYVPMAQILDHLRSLYAKKWDTSDYWQRILDAPVLALDEVTRVNPTDWARERTFLLIDIRYRRRRSHLTLFASNKDPASERGDGYFGYLFSRLREGRCVELRGDFRPAAGAGDGIKRPLDGTEDRWAERKDLE